MEKKNKKGAGRKKKTYDEQVILNLIYTYIQETGLAGIVKYQDIHPYCLRLYEEGTIPFKLSEDFWRKPGKQGTLLLQKVNEVSKEEVEVHEQDKENVVNTEDAINKLFEGKETNKKKLIDSLRINEVKLKKYIEQYNQQRLKINELQNHIERQKENSKELIQKNNELQKLLFSIMEYSSSLNFPIANLITTGITRTNPVYEQLKGAFGEAPNLLYEYDQYIKKKKGTEKEAYEKVKSLNDNRKTAFDDFNL
ncbi:hypothetical protein CN481_00215 [Bacillus sp. AFS006103]|nr:hypothetical protein CN481_00215 [Bacillus sp. AFS006103]